MKKEKMWDRILRPSCFGAEHCPKGKERKDCKYRYDCNREWMSHEPI